MGKEDKAVEDDRSPRRFALGVDGSEVFNESSRTRRCNVTGAAQRDKIDKENEATAHQNDWYL
jgi:hypothetical protein